MENKIYSLIIPCFLTLFLMTCDKDDESNNCNYSNPIEELDWLKSSIEEIEQGNDNMSKYSYINSAKYKGETVFFYGNCHPAINYASFVLNCNGDTLGNTNRLYADLTDIKILWKHDESMCNFNEYE